jgi:DNA-binding NtrC family response regulator
MLNAFPVLVVCSNPAHSEKAAEVVRGIGLRPVVCSSLTDACALVEQHAFQLVVCSDDLPDCNLRTSLKVLSSATGGAPVIVLSHLADWDAYMKALSAGAFDYIACPPEQIETERIMRLALNQDSTLRPASHNAA